MDQKLKTVLKFTVFHFFVCLIFQKNKWNEEEMRYCAFIQVHTHATPTAMKA